MACSSVRYGPRVTQEVGQDVGVLGAKKVLVMTDANLASMQPVKAVLDSLTRYNVQFSLYDSVRVEPTDSRCVYSLSQSAAGLSRDSRVCVCVCVCICVRAHVCWLFSYVYTYYFFLWQFFCVLICYNVSYIYMSIYLSVSVASNIWQRFLFNYYNSFIAS